MFGDHSLEPALETRLEQLDAVLGAEPVDRRGEQVPCNREPGRVTGGLVERQEALGEVEEAADGSLVWRARVAGTIEIRLWILSWGDTVEVLAPASLREDVAATHARAAAGYAVARARA